MPPEPGHSHKADILIVLIGAIVVIEWMRQGAAPYDWDVDHMLYFGQRILAGAFHWSGEFDDKLPVLNLLFTVPAAFGTVLAWRLLSLTLLLCGAVAVAVIVTGLLHDSTSLRRADRARYGLLGGVAWLYLATFLPGGISHINAPAAAFGTVALAALQLALQGTGARRLRAGLVLLSVFAASTAIGMRPYLLLALVAGGTWLHLRRATDRAGRWSALRAATGWTALVGAAGLAVNFAPYVALGQTEAFWAGLSLLTQTLIPQTRAEIAADLLHAFTRANIVVVAISLAGLASGVIGLTMLARRRAFTGLRHLRRRLIFADMVLWSLVLPALIGLAIFGKHFWPHYLQMFSPFLAIGCATLLAVFAHERLTGVDRGGRRRALLSWALPLLLLAAPSIDLFLTDRHRAAPPRAQIAGIVDRLRMERPADRRDFLFLDDMYAHWSRAEPRHGFPHAAHTLFIHDGWWQDIEMPEHFGHPETLRAYCAQLETSGPTLVFAGGRVSGFVDGCLRPSAVYTRIHDAPDLPLSAFERRAEGTGPAD